MNIVVNEEDVKTVREEEALIEIAELKTNPLLHLLFFVYDLCRSIPQFVHFTKCIMEVMKLYNNEHVLKSYEAIRLAKRAYLNGDTISTMIYASIANKERIEDLKQAYEALNEQLEEYRQRIEC